MADERRLVKLEAVAQAASLLMTHAEDWMRLHWPREYWPLSRALYAALNELDLVPDPRIEALHHLYAATRALAERDELRQRSRPVWELIRALEGRDDAD